MNIDGKVGLPYNTPNDVIIKDNESLNYGFNNAVQQLVDNDLYIQKSLEEQKRYQPGPEILDDYSIQKEIDNYKYMKYDESGLKILQKKEHTLSSTLYKVNNCNALYAFKDGRYYVLATDGLYVGYELSTLAKTNITCNANTTKISAVYYNVDNHTLLFSGSGELAGKIVKAYDLDQQNETPTNINNITIQVKYPNNTTNLTETITEITYDTISETMYIGTTTQNDIDGYLYEFVGLNNIKDLNGSILVTRIEPIDSKITTICPLSGDINTRKLFAGTINGLYESYEDFQFGNLMQKYSLPDDATLTVNDFTQFAGYDVIATNKGIYAYNSVTYQLTQLLQNKNVKALKEIDGKLYAAVSDGVYEYTNISTSTQRKICTLTSENATGVCKNNNGVLAISTNKGVLVTNTLEASTPTFVRIDKTLNVNSICSLDQMFYAATNDKMYKISVQFGKHTITSKELKETTNSSGKTIREASTALSFQITNVKKLDNTLYILTNVGVFDLQYNKLFGLNASINNIKKYGRYTLVCSSKGIVVNYENTNRVYLTSVNVIDATLYNDTIFIAAYNGSSATTFYEANIYDIEAGKTNAFSRMQIINGSTWQDSSFDGVVTSLEILNNNIYVARGNNISCIPFGSYIKTTDKTNVFNPGSDITNVNFMTDTSFVLHSNTLFTPDGSDLNIEMYLNVKEKNTSSKSKLYGLDYDSMSFVELTAKTKPVIFVNPTSDYGIKNVINVGNNDSKYTVFTLSGANEKNIYFFEHNSGTNRYDGVDTIASFNRNPPTYKVAAANVNSLIDITNTVVDENISKYLINRTKAGFLVGTDSGIYKLQEEVEIHGLSSSKTAGPIDGIAQFDMSEYLAFSVNIDGKIQQSKEAMYMAIKSGNLLSAATGSKSDGENNNKFDYAMLKSCITGKSLTKAKIFNSINNNEPQQVYISNSSGISCIDLVRNEDVDGSITQYSYSLNITDAVAVFTANSGDEIKDFDVSPNGTLFVATKSTIYAKRNNVLKSVNLESGCLIDKICIALNNNNTYYNVGIATYSKSSTYGAFLFEYSATSKTFTYSKHNSCNSRTSWPIVIKNIGSNIYLACRVGTDQIAVFTSVNDNIHIYNIDGITGSGYEFNLFNSIDSRNKRQNGWFIQNSTTHDLISMAIDDDLFILDDTTIEIENQRETIYIDANLNVHQLFTLNADDFVYDGINESLMYIVKSGNKIAKLTRKDLPDNTLQKIVPNLSQPILNISKVDVTKDYADNLGRHTLTKTNIVACVKTSSEKYQVRAGRYEINSNLNAVSPAMTAKLVDAIADISNNVVMYIDESGKLYYSNISYDSNANIVSATPTLSQMQINLNGKKAFRFCNIYDTIYILLADGLYTIKFQNGIASVGQNIPLDSSASIREIYSNDDLIIAKTSIGEYSQDQIGSTTFYRTNTKTHTFEDAAYDVTTVVNNGILCKYNTYNDDRTYEYIEASNIDTLLRALKPNIKGFFMTNDNLNVIDSRGVWNVTTTSRVEDNFSQYADVLKIGQAEVSGAKKLIEYGNQLAAYGCQKTFTFSETEYNEVIQHLSQPTFIGIFDGLIFVCDSEFKNVYYSSSFSNEFTKLNTDTPGLNQIYHIAKNVIVAAGGVYSYSNVIFALCMKKFNGSLANCCINDICRISNNQALISTSRGVYWLRGYTTIKNQILRPNNSEFAINISDSNEENADVKSYLVQYSSSVTSSGKTTKYTDLYLSQDEKFTKWKKLFSFNTNNTTIKSVCKIDKYVYLIAGTAGLSATRYEYELQNNFTGQTMEDINIAIANKCKSEISSHISAMHGENSFITVLNKTVLPVDFSDVAPDWQSIDNECVVIENDLVQHINFGFAGQHVSAFYANANSLSDQTYVEDLTYIDKQYMSNMHELYINLPTTGTEYFPLQIYSNSKADLSGIVDKNSTYVYVLLDPEYFDIQNMLEVLINGNSLPLGIKNTEDLYGDEGKTFHSFVLPSISKYAPLMNDVDASNLKMLSGAYVFEFRCFGSDAQSIKLLFKEKNKYTVKFKAAYPAYGFMEDQQFTVGETQALAKNEFVLDGSLFKQWNYVGIDGNMHKYSDCDEISSSFNSNNKSLTNNNGVEFALSAEFQTYNFTNTETIINFRNTDVAYIHDAQSCKYLSGGSEYNGIVVDYGV